ncbi:MAG: signal peptidase II [Acidobacteriota bacterium]
MTHPADRPTALRDRAFPKRLYLLLALIVLVLDQWSKWLIEAHLPLYASIDLIPGLNFTHVRNTGVAFGLFAAHGDAMRTAVLSGLALVTLGILGVYFRRIPRAERLLLTALGLVLGGAVGNLIDRITSGGVTDFIDVYVGTYHWHTFNIADSAISVGIGVMLLHAFRPELGRVDKVDPAIDGGGGEAADAEGRP